MAQLKSSTVTGDLGVSNQITSPKVQTGIIRAPSTSGGNSYSAGTNGQVLKSNGTSTYWATDRTVVDISTSTTWTGTGPYTQNITVSGVTASNFIIVGLASTASLAEYNAACAAKILCTAQATNSITLTAFGAAPTIAIPFTVLIEG